VKIGNGPTIQTETIEGPNIQEPVQYEIYPQWNFTQTLDTDMGIIPIFIQLGDEDFGADDGGDISYQPQEIAVKLNYNLNTGTWTGNVPINTAYSSGPTDGNHDEDGSAEIFFDIQLRGIPNLAVNYDTDSDGIPDLVELSGLYDENQTLVDDRGAMRSDPCRKTVLVELDYMKSQKLHPLVLARLANMFWSVPPLIQPLKQPTVHFQLIQTIPMVLIL
jgi:hypothetical protein